MPISGFIIIIIIISYCYFVPLYKHYINIHDTPISKSSGHSLLSDYACGQKNSPTTPTRTVLSLKLKIITNNHKPVKLFLGST